MSRALVTVATNEASMRDPADLRRTMILVSWGVFVSTLAQTATIGALPLRTILKDKLHVDATREFGVTAGVGALMLLTVVPLTWRLLAEPRVAHDGGAAWVNAWRQIKATIASRWLWAAAGLLFLVHLSPGFSMVLYFHMSNDLKFGSTFIGYTDAAYGVGGVVASLIYVMMI